MFVRRVLAVCSILLAACSSKGDEPSPDNSVAPDTSTVADVGTTDVGSAADVPNVQDTSGGDLDVIDASSNDVGSDAADMRCPDGFAVADNVCVDVDECADGSHNCDVNATCTNIDGAFTCACNVGFNGDGVTCTDMGRCATDPCGTGGDVGAVCTDEATGYTCACTTGYSFDGVTCSDTDECLGNPCDDGGDVNGACTDASAPATGYSCMCGGGFVSDGTTCVAPPSNRMSFFVSSSSPSPNGDGNLGGLAGADAHCQMLAESVDPNDTRSWVAYLSTEGGPGTTDDVNARDRIGTGPWFNAAGQMFAADLAALHDIQTAIIACNPGPPTCLQDRADYVAAKPADALFLDENGIQITDPLDPAHLPLPNGGDRGHDIFTGSQPDGTVLPGATCADWTSASNADIGQVGHTDVPANTQFSPSWNSAHEALNCSQNGVRSRGGAGFVYCFTPD